jgi:hypothetical protein
VPLPLQSAFKKQQFFEGKKAQINFKKFENKIKKNLGGKIKTLTFAIRFKKTEISS